MKKVNFNALQNFEVPESWIENAINAKPKKKPFYLNPLYYGTAAALVIAVGIAAFSLLYLNRDFTPPTGQNVEGTSVSSTLSGQRLTEILSGGEMKTTELQNEKKPTEKQKSTGATEQNENSVEQSVASDEQHNESSESENHSPVQAEESEQDEQSNNTKKPESIIKPQNPTAPIEQQKSSEQENNMSEEPESTVPTKEYIITKSWTRQISYYSGAGADVSTSTDDNNPDTLGTLESFEELSFFNNEISVLVSGDIWKWNCKKIECIINGADENTEGIKGTLDFVFYNNTTENVLSFNPSTESINIPCGKYNIFFKYYKYRRDTKYTLIEELPTTEFLETSLENDETKPIVFQL